MAESSKTRAESDRTNASDHGHTTIHDGGKELARLHYQPTIPFLPNSPPGALSGQQGGKVADRLRQDLKKARYYLQREGEPHFVPLDKLIRIINQSSVSDLLRELSSAKDMSEAQIQHLSMRICWDTDSPSRYCCRRLVATLLELNMEDCIPVVVEKGVTDNCLPPVTDSNTTYGKKQQEELDIVYRDLNLDEEAQHDFRRAANKYNIPFFTRSKNTVNHYIFHCTTIVPFISHSETTTSEEFHKTGGHTTDGQGGFSKVWRTKIHASHHNFSGYGTSTKNIFAIKELHADDDEAFEAEINALIRFSHKNDTQLVKLLATYKVERDDGAIYYLIFPWAEGSVRRMWRNIPDVLSNNPNCDLYNLAWIGKQALAITQALVYLHEDYAKTYDPPKDLDPEKWGRHGDIKAANFLVYHDPESNEGPRIFLADFGLARFSRHKTRSNQHPRLASPSYRPPEVDQKKSLSRKSDIWSLGAFFLEFLTWYLEGWKAVDEVFPSTRETRDHNDVTSDIFFLIENFKKPDGTIELRAAVKPTVLYWISRLHQNEACTHFVHDLLEVIKKDMLVVKPSERISASDLAKKLETMVANGDDYLRKRRAYLGEGGRRK